MAYIDLQTQQLIDDDAVRSRFMPTIVNRLNDVPDDQLAAVNVARIEFVETDPPALAPWELCEPGPIDKSEPGVWRTTWIVTSVPLADVKAAAHARINRERNAMLASDLLLLPAANSVWQYNASSLQVLNETLLMTGVDEEIFLPPFWRDAYNTNHVCTRNLLIAIAASYAAYKAEVWAASWAMKAAIDDPGTEIAGVAAITWSDFLTPATAAAALPCIGQTYTPTEEE